MRFMAGLVMILLLVTDSNPYVFYQSKLSLSLPQHRAGQRTRFRCRSVHRGFIGSFSLAFPLSFVVSAREHSRLQLVILVEVKNTELFHPLTSSNNAIDLCPSVSSCIVVALRWIISLVDFHSHVRMVEI